MTLFCFTSMQAQQHRERWKATDYFPEHHFVPPNAKTQWDSIRIAVKAGEVAFYMRLAGLVPWKDTSREEALTLVRVSMLPKYSHPMFIEVVIFDDYGQLSFRQGNAICGYVEHSTYMELSDTGYYDATEEHYKGNQWTEGIMETQERYIAAEQMDSVPNYMNVAAAIRELEKIELIRGADGIYRLDHAVTKTQRTILNAFGISNIDIKAAVNTISEQFKPIDYKR